MTDAPDRSTLRAQHAVTLAARREVVHAAVQQILGPQYPPFVLEIGSGHGHFLTAYAAAHLAQSCIGIDIVSERLERAEKKRVRAKLTNVHFVRAEARLFLESLPIQARISEVFVLFPDPWPKLRHHKHRLLQGDFLRQLALHATDRCALYFRTDHQPYFGEARAAVERSPDWELTSEPWPFEYTTVFQSRAAAHESFVARKRAV